MVGVSCGSWESRRARSLRLRNRRLGRPDDYREPPRLSVEEMEEIYLRVCAELDIDTQWPKLHQHQCRRR